MIENNQKSTDDSKDDAIPKDLNKQTSEGTEAEQLKGSDADQDNGGDASLSEDDISGDKDK